MSFRLLKIYIDSAPLESSEEKIYSKSLFRKNFGDIKNYNFIVNSCSINTNSIDFLNEYNFLPIEILHKIKHNKKRIVISEIYSEIQNRSDQEPTELYNDIFVFKNFTVQNFLKNITANYKEDINKGYEVYTLNQNIEVAIFDRLVKPPKYKLFLNNRMLVERQFPLLPKKKILMEEVALDCSKLKKLSFKLEGINLHIVKIAVDQKEYYPNSDYFTIDL